MEHYQNRHLRQVEHAAKQSEANDMKSKNNMMRKQWLERQTNANYRNEYGRIRGDLSHPRIQYRSMMQLRNREQELSRLFSSGSV